MTDAKGDRSKRPARAGQPRHLRAHCRAQRRRHRVSGAKAIVTAAPYVHELLVMPCRNMSEADADFAVAARCRLTPRHDDRRAARPAGRARSSSTVRAVLAQVRPVHRRRALRPRVRPVGARVPTPASGSTAGSDLQLRDPSSADLHCGARRLWRPADRRRRADVRGQWLRPRRETNLREPMVELIKIVEGFYACGVAASVYGAPDPYAASRCRTPVFANIGKLLMAPDLRHASAGPPGLGRADRDAAGAGRRPQPGDRRPACRSAAREPGHALRQAHRGRRAYRGPDGLVPGRLVFGDQPARRRLTGGDEDGDLAQLSARQQGRSGGAVARAQCPEPAIRGRQDCGRLASRGSAATHGCTTDRRRTTMVAFARPTNPEKHPDERPPRTRDYADSTAARSTTATASGASRPRSIDWHTPFDTVSTTAGRRSRTGSSAARPTSATTRSTGISRRAATSPR